MGQESSVRNRNTSGEFRRRILMTIIGVTICGFSVGLFSFSDMGVDPFQVLMHGTYTLTPFSFGTYYTIASIVLFVLILLINRRKIGLGTLINMFLFGYIVEFSEWGLHKLLPDPNLAMKFIALLIAVVVMCFASALYFTADLGVSVYDAVALTISERQPKLKFKYVRIATDLVCVIVGGLCGGTIGIGTLVTAFFMGPLISYFNGAVAEPLRYGRKKAV